MRRVMLCTTLVLVAVAATTVVSAFSTSNTMTMMRQCRPFGGGAGAGAGGMTTCPRRVISSSSSSLSLLLHSTARNSMRLAAQGEDAAEEAEEAAEGDASATATEDETAEGDEKKEEEEEEEEEEEDPEMTALKEEISKLEEELKTKRMTVDAILKQAEDYTKEGYARKVAEIDQIRRLQESSKAASGFVQRAVVLQSFLPVLDKLTELNTVTYADNEFAQANYSALLGAFLTALRELNASEYSAGEVGSPVDVQRVETVREEYSTQHPKGTVLEALTDGLEVGGNVIRMATCVASLGPEEAEGEEAAEEKEETEAKEEDSAATTEESEE